MYTEFSEEQLAFIKEIDHIYLKLFWLINFTCVNQNNLGLMYEIYKNTNNINTETEKCTYLLKCYFDYSKYKDIYILKYIGIPIKIDELDIMKDALQEIKKFKIQHEDIFEDKKNIDYNLSRLKKYTIKTKVLRQNLRRKIKMPKIIRKKREL